MRVSTDGEGSEVTSRNDLGAGQKKGDSDLPSLLLVALPNSSPKRSCLHAQESSQLTLSPPNSLENPRGTR